MAAVAASTVVNSSLIETSSDKLVLEGSFSKERHRDPAVFAVPFSLDGLPIISADEYVERSSEFALMHEYFFGSEEKHRKIFILWGLGGIGKTQLAMGFARRYKDAFSSVFFFDLSSQTNLEQNVSAALDRVWDSWPTDGPSRFRRPPEKGLTPERMMEDIKRWFENPMNQDWLIIFDSIDPHPGEEEDSTKLLKKALPSSDHGSIIVTTRSRCFVRFGRGHEVGKMKREDARKLFDGRMHSSLPTYSEVAADSSEVQKAKENLLESLDGFPLALAQAGAFINNTGTSIQDFMELYNESKIEIMQDLPGVEDRTDDKANIFTTWKVSLDLFMRSAAGTLRHNAGNLFLLCGYLDAQDIGYDLLRRGLLDPGVPEWFSDVMGTKTTFLKTMGVLRDYSLINSNPSANSTYTMHNLVHDYCQAQATALGRTDLLRLATSIVGYALPPFFHEDFYALRAKVHPHVDVLLRVLKGRVDFDITPLDISRMDPLRKSLAVEYLGTKFKDLSTEGAYNPLIRIIMVLEDWERWNEATSLLESFLSRLEPSPREGWPDHYTFLEAQAELAWIKAYAFDIFDIESIQRVVDGVTRLYGADSRETLRYTRYMGLFRSWEDDHRAALEIFRESYNRSIARFGETDLDSILILRNLANEYHSAEQPAEAEALLRDGYQRLRARLGKDHHYTVSFLGNLAQAYKGNEKLGESVECRLNVLQASEKLLGPDDPETVDRALSLAASYEANESLAEAEATWTRLLESMREKPRRNEIAYASALRNLAAFYTGHNRVPDALPCLGEANAIYTRLSGNPLPLGGHLLNEMISGWLDVGLEYLNAGKPGVAAEILERILPVSEKLFNENCSHLFRNMTGLLRCYRALENVEKLIPMVQKSNNISDDCRVLKSTRDGLFEALGNALLTLTDHDFYAESMTVLENCLAYFEKKDGPRRYRTILTSKILGITYFELGMRDKGRVTLGKAADVLDRTEGDARFLAADCLYSLGKHDQIEGNLNDAAVRISRAVEVFRDDTNKLPLLQGIASLGWVYIVQGENTLAKKVFQEAIDTEISDTDRNTRDLAIVKSGLGRVLAEEGDVEEAVSLMRSAIAIFTALGKDGVGDVPITANNLGRTLLQHNRLEDAIGVYKQLYQFEKQESTFDSATRAATCTMLSICYICSRQFNEARNWLKTASGEFGSSTPAWEIARLERFGSLVDLTERWITDQDPETREASGALPRPWLLSVDCLTARLLDPSGSDLLNDIFLPRVECEMPRTSLDAKTPSQKELDRNEVSGLAETLTKDIQDAAHILGSLQKRFKDGDWEHVLSQLPATLQAGISHSAPLQGPSCWTYTPDPTSPVKAVPLTIAGAPVVIPVRYRYPLLAPTGTPPDPYRPFIDPSAPLSDHTVKEIFRTYRGAQGFYLLLNGMLQLLVPKGFDYAQALATKPIKFGGLDVSYIPMSVVPTASSSKTATTDRHSTRDTSVTTIVTEGGRRRSGLRFLSHSWETISHSLRLRHTTQTTMPPGGLQINSVLEARVHGRRGPLGWRYNNHSEPERPSGRLGLHISTSNRSREFLTMSTHVLHKAFHNSRRQAVSSLSSSFNHLLSSPTDTRDDQESWTEQVEVYSGDTRVGKVAKSYDPSAGHGDFPIDYIHDLSLIEPLNRSIVKDIHSPEPNLGWLTEEGWQNLRRDGGPLKMLGLDEDKPEAMHLPVHESSEFQIVGAGVVINADLDDELSRRQRELKAHATSQAMARCILYRVWPPQSNPFAFSGMALYTIGPREPVNGQDIGVGPAVVGFQSFYQEGGKNQDRVGNLAYQDLYRWFEDGSVTFYAAYQVPEEVRKMHCIL